MYIYIYIHTYILLWDFGDVIRRLGRCFKYSACDLWKCDMTHLHGTGLIFMWKDSCIQDITRKESRTKYESRTVYTRVYETLRVKSLRVTWRHRVSSCVTECELPNVYISLKLYLWVTNCICVRNCESRVFESRTVYASGIFLRHCALPTHHFCGVHQLYCVTH